MAIAVPAARRPGSRGAARWRRFVWRSNGASRAAFVFLCLIVAIAAAPGLVARYDPIQMSPDAVLAFPSAAHPFGTDEFGRDIASRVVYGARTSLGYAVLATAISTAVGTVIGVTTAYYSGAFDSVVMRAIDVLMAFPGILLALIVVTLLGPGLTHAMVAVGIGQTPGVGRVVRSATLGAKSNQYIEASRAVGGSGSWIMRRHLLPNIRHIVLVLATLGYGAAILVGASLSFLGLGAQPPTPEWGSMLETARGYLQSNWWVGVLPGVVLGATLLCVNVVGDQLRDILDPSLRLD